MVYIPDEKKDNLYYTKLFEKCSTKEKESGEFEECCKDEVNKTFKKEVGKGNIIGFEINGKKNLENVAEKDIYNSIRKIGKKAMNNNLDKIEKVIDNGG